MCVEVGTNDTAMLPYQARLEDEACVEVGTNDMATLSYQARLEDEACVEVGINAGTGCW